MDSTPVILSSTNGDEEEEEEWIISKSCKNIHKQIGTKLDEEELLDLIDTGSYIHLSSSSSSYTTTATNSTSSPSSSFSSNSRKRSLSMISDEEVGELRAVDDDYGNVSSSSDGHFHFNKKSCKVKKIDKSFTSMKCRKPNKNKNIIRWTSGNQEIDILLREIKSIKGQNENTFLWIDFEKFKDICEIGKGGFATVYRAMWIRSLKIYIKASIQISSLLPIYGITQDSVTKDYMIVMKYMPHGNLYRFMKTRPKIMTLKEKQQLIHEIIRSLHKLHFANLIQQNLHGGNILINYHEQDPPIDDGYIYSVGIILWEIFLEQLAFYNRSHDSRLQLEISDGLRPNVVVNGIPKCFIELMKKCWDNCSKNRPTIEEVLAMLDRWHLLPDDSFLSLEVFS
ncbi:15965_t:CDS:2, partial [Entrophospora sp. SA101]